MDQQQIEKGIPRMFRIFLSTCVALLIVQSSTFAGITLFLSFQADTVEEHIEKAREAIKAKRYSDAKNELNAVLKMQQDSPQAYLLLADVFYREDKISPAIEYARNAIKYDPAFGEAYYFLGSLLLKSDKLNEAQNVLAEGLKRQPDYGLLYILKGDFELAASQPTKGLKAYDPKLDSAVKAYEEALRLLPTENNNRRIIQDILLGLKNYIELIQHEDDSSYVKAKPISRPDIPYPEMAKRLGRQGDVRMGLVVNERGQVVTVQLFTHLGHGIEEAAVEAARKVRFSPAVKAGKPIATWTRLVINFS